MKDILLYGSVLQRPDAHDIDMLVLHHNGYNMQNFTRSKSVIEDRNIHIYSSAAMVLGLGWRPSSDIMNDIKGSVDRRICHLLEEKGLLKQDGEPDYAEKFNVLLDVHMFNVALLHEPSQDEIHISPWMAENIVRQRQDAIENSGTDPLYYRRIFTEGRLYDRAANDFITPFEDKYPGKLHLFPAPPSPESLKLRKPKVR